MLHYHLPLLNHGITCILHLRAHIEHVLPPFPSQTTETIAFLPSSSPFVPLPSPLLLLNHWNHCIPPFLLTIEPLPSPLLFSNPWKPLYFTLPLWSHGNPVIPPLRLKPLKPLHSAFPLWNYWNPSCLPTFKSQSIKTLAFYLLKL